MRRAALFGATSLLWLQLLTPALAFEVPPNDGFVTDTASVLSTEEETNIEKVLKDFRDRTSNEIAVVIIPSLDGEILEDVALQIGRKWGVGTKERDNGIVMLISMDDRAITLSVGYGLEGAIPDIVAKGVIDNDILPHFRRNETAQGILAGIDALEKHIGGEYTVDRYTHADSAWSLEPFTLFLFFLFGEWILAILARTKSWWAGGVLGGIGGVILTMLYSFWISIPILVIIGLFLDYVVSKNFRSRGKTKWWAGGRFGPGGGGGFSGGSSGGGFGGFGGGSFGGGGASGRW
jgi:uncharacterized protein